MRLKRPLAWLLMLLGLVIALPDPLAKEGAGAEVWMVSFDGALGPAAGDLIVRSIENAQAAGAVALIIQMDTPGGLDKAMRDVVKAILSADIVVISFVHPDGARAASAGTYIAYASHISAMSPATNIGSSTPVSIAPTPSIPGEPDEKGDARPAPQDAMMKKVVNDAVAYLQGLAELRGRNIEWAEETVREGANLRASAALAKNVIDLIAKDVPTLLAAVDGREIELPNRTVTLDVAGARVVLVETDWRHELLEVITDPSIAYGLLIFGVYALILEFYNPGMVFPGVVGVICLLLGAYGMQMLPVNYAGLALMVVGIGMMVGEAFTPTMGALGVAGVVAFVMGSIMLMDTQQPGYQVPILIIAAFAVTSAALTLFTVGAAVRARNQEVVTGKDAMVGKQAEALEDFESQGWVRAFGESWQAESSKPVKEQAVLKIVAVEGLILKVQPEDG